MADARENATATLLPDGELLAEGGYDGSDPASATAEMYDPATDSWRDTGTMSVGRYGNTATSLTDGRALVAGDWLYGSTWLASAAMAVWMGGFPGAPTSASDGAVSVKVPNGALTGRVSVLTPLGFVWSAGDFLVLPKVKSFVPASGPPGTVVTITGTALTGATAVQFNGKSASFTVNSYTQISATVPVGATSGRISITTPSGKAKSKTTFTVT